MNALTVVLALLAAFANAAASVLMRRAATETPDGEADAGAVGGRAPDTRGGGGGNGRQPGGSAGTQGCRHAAGGAPSAPGADHAATDAAPEQPGQSENLMTGSGTPAGTTARTPGGDRGAGGPETDRSRRAVRTKRRRFWLGGATLLAGSAVLQAGALAVGSLSLVQPLLATELLFTLVIGSIVFHRRPDRATWLSFLSLAAGLALFLGAAAPSAGRDTADPSRWILVGAVALCAVLFLLGVARLVNGPPRAAVLGLASAILFAATAALMKQITGQSSQGLAALATDWSPYATAFTGLAAFGLLQWAFRAGTLVASQPALTLGDALTSMALGWALFGEHIGLGVRMLPEAAGVGLLAAGTVGLARAPAVSGKWDADPAPEEDPERGRAEAERP
ncbi:DMT family transporter [Streptomyces sp. Li-HN-5-11]|uniref:DMT family transporter n=1 Tax=Streptomyces sp. Li-HN-5-11 TaxID=3075432 RepID=UPI0028ADDCF5|nr:DMT family transporter [Streptomyces sp. Li-HN-5-11]WNM31655.1 DMT family transporter [Streptomyces sp. Li-HN-5-11]